MWVYSLQICYYAINHFCLRIFFMFKNVLYCSYVVCTIIVNLCRPVPRLLPTVVFHTNPFLPLFTPLLLCCVFVQVVYPDSHLFLYLLLLILWAPDSHQQSSHLTQNEREKDLSNTKSKTRHVVLNQNCWRAALDRTFNLGKSTVYNLAKNANKTSIAVMHSTFLSSMIILHVRNLSVENMEKMLPLVAERSTR